MADEKETVANLLKERTEAVVKVLQKNDIDEQVKKSLIMNIIVPIFDFQLIAKLTLGKANWGKLSEKQQKVFVDLLVDRLQNLIFDKSELFYCMEISFKPAVVHGNKVYVPINIETKDTPLEMLYKFYSSDEGWKSYDVEVNGVSLIKSYQVQFSEILKSGNAEDLLARLRKPVEE
ncbi:MAG: ABC transporter substrate-binding protein [Desulfobacteraceae bacterium]|nr:ABC transporter substrate-binding protein [Desulfobacteraceae bacterium]